MIYQTLQTICECSLYLFADDAKLYIGIIILSDEDHYSLQSGLCALQEWLDKWLRKLNASRCKSVHYSRNINRNYVYNYVLCRIVYTILTCRYCKNVNLHMHLRTAS